MEQTEVATIGRIRADRNTVEAMRARMNPGTVLMTVDLPLSADTRTGKDFVIMADHDEVVAMEAVRSEPLLLQSGPMSEHKLLEFECGAWFEARCLRQRAPHHEDVVILARATVSVAALARSIDQRSFQFTHVFMVRCSARSDEPRTTHCRQWSR